MPVFDHCLFMFFNKQIIRGKSSKPDNFGIFTIADLAAADYLRIANTEQLYYK